MKIGEKVIVQLRLIQVGGEEDFTSKTISAFPIVTLYGKIKLTPKELGTVAWNENVCLIEFDLTGHSQLIDLSKL